MLQKSIKHTTDIIKMLRKRKFKLINMITKLAQNKNVNMTFKIYVAI